MSRASKRQQQKAAMEQPQASYDDKGVRIPADKQPKPRIKLPPARRG